MVNSSLSLQHVIRASSLSKDAPLLIILHGYGSNENYFLSFANELPEELFIIFVRAPYSLQPYGNAWYSINWGSEQSKWGDNNQTKQSRDLIANFIDEAIATYPVNKHNVTLLGFSQGAVLGYAVALTYPEKVKNIIALSGYINEDILSEDIKTKGYSHLDFYSSHGSVDQVIPVEWARQTPVFLSNLAVKHKYSEFPVGHGVATQNFHEFREWLSKRI